jgi:hypothetical protein
MIGIALVAVAAALVLAPSAYAGARRPRRRYFHRFVGSRGPRSDVGRFVTAPRRSANAPIGAGMQCSIIDQFATVRCA